MNALAQRYTDLIGETVSLIPLKRSHQDDLVISSRDGDLSSLWFTSVPNEKNIATYYDNAERELAQGVSLPYAVKENKSGKIIGSTRFCNIDINNRRVEIGYTWYAKSYQRTVVNTECKLLLLTHAFECLNAIAVEFRTHWHNHKSRAAILRLGAKQDGVLRNHKIHPEGEYRDTVVFSIIESEWPIVKKSLQYKQNQYK